MHSTRNNVCAALLLVLTACSAADASEESDAGDAADGPTLDGARPDAREAGRPNSGDAGDATIADAGPCGEDMALVQLEAGRACIDLYEGAIVVANEGDRPWPHYDPLDGVDASFRAVPARGIAPQGYISAEQAQAACEASG